ncbi:uncharacterized protein LOC111636989 isoform X2 [Centruroides sculpturatus]|uniref:uncharacterized protein LOC111636989 isoform X2 n=1 Tax=Centruroides sculpturatus TaxID=218467 RepID=UPI000C6D3821|nr:uncharacterized protein LOC111636989 isoform X2 [Centruroides sculpturatus]
MLYLLRIKRMLYLDFLILLVFGCFASCWIHKCPRMEDIHPCFCSSHHTRNPHVPDTIVVCQNINNEKILMTSLREMKNYSIDVLIFDHCVIPSFPNDILKDIRIGTIELIRSTVQLNNKFVECINHC